MLFDNNSGIITSRIEKCEKLARSFHRSITYPKTFLNIFRYFVRVNSNHI